MRSLKYSLKCSAALCCALLSPILYSQKTDSPQGAPSLRLDNPPQTKVQDLPQLQVLEDPIQSLQTTGTTTNANKRKEEESAKVKKHYFSSLYPPIEKATGKLYAPFWERYWPLTALFALIVAISLWILLRPRRAVPKSPYEIAVVRLAQAMKSYDEGGAKAFAHAVSRAVRDYIEQVHNIPAPERTTEEFLQIALNSEKFDNTQKTRLSEILKLSDMAKFALHPLQNNEIRGLLNASTEFIETDMRNITKSMERSSTVSGIKTGKPGNTGRKDSETL